MGRPSLRPFFVLPIYREESLPPRLCLKICTAFCSDFRKNNLRSLTIIFSHFPQPSHRSNSLDIMYLSAGSFLSLSLFQHARQNSAIIILTSVITNNRWYILHSNPAYLSGQERLWVKKMRDILAKRLKQCRKERGLTQWEVAVYCDISEKAYQNYELMTREPKLEILAKVADLFDVSLDYLVGRTDIKPVNRPK